MIGFKTKGGDLSIFNFDPIKSNEPLLLKCFHSIDEATLIQNDQYIYIAYVKDNNLNLRRIISKGFVQEPNMFIALYNNSTNQKKLVKTSFNSRTSLINSKTYKIVMVKGEISLCIVAEIHLVSNHSIIYMIDLKERLVKLKFSLSNINLEYLEAFATNITEICLVLLEDKNKYGLRYTKFDISSDSNNLKLDFIKHTFPRKIEEIHCFSFSEELALISFYTNQDHQRQIISYSLKLSQTLKESYFEGDSTIRYLTLNSHHYFVLASKSNGEMKFQMLCSNSHTIFKSWVTKLEISNFESSQYLFGVEAKESETGSDDCLLFIIESRTLKSVFKRYNIV